MTTEHRWVALSEAPNRARNSAEIEHCPLRGRHQVEAAALAAKVERRPER
jgi:hypothetical protein